MSSPHTPPLQTLFASCPKGVELLLADELTALGAESVKTTVAGVDFIGTLSLAYRCSLWSRLASRILLQIDCFKVANKEDLYQGVKNAEWEDHLDERMSLRVDYHGKLTGVDNTRYGSQLVKDAIIDRMRAKRSGRPSVDTTNPDLVVDVHVRGQSCSVALNFSGRALHRRGYRLESGDAPLKENLAAAMLIRAGWPEMAKSGRPLLDVMCGSGTLPIEGAMMAADVAPGLFRREFGFDRWPNHIPKIWQDLLAEARERQQIGIESLQSTITGYDSLGSMVHRARNNIERAGLARCVHIKRSDLRDLLVSEETAGLVICNPPYGERLGEEASLVYLYRHLGEQLKLQCPGWQAAVLSGKNGLVNQLGMGIKKRYTLYNGPLECQFSLFDIRDRTATPAADNNSQQKKQPKRTNRSSSWSDGARMFANRLEKNRRQLTRWVRKHQLQCYRLYDADMPEYALAIDIYRDWVHVQEYAPPKSVSVEAAAKRRSEALSVIPEVLGIPEEQVVLKQRERQSGSSQYNRRSQRGELLEVSEGGCRFLVNLFDYIDTGLFPDHRLMRMRIQQESAGKRFLNLFCYTGTATVHAAVGGATTSTSVDLSNTWLEYARKNLALNGLSEQRHRLVRADCMQWLQQETNEYDLIFIDPPTFSNSKKLDKPFDIQRMQLPLIEMAIKCLAVDGTIYFSNNFRKFQLAAELSERYSVEEISKQTVDRDFQRKGAHRSWRISKSKEHTPKRYKHLPG